MIYDSGAVPNGSGPTTFNSHTPHGRGSSVPTISEYLDDFVRRVILDALNEGTALYWQHRAETFEAARWKPGDFTGNATIAELDACDRRLRETARACRSRAQLALDAGVGELDG